MSRSRRNAKADEYFRRAPNYSAEAISDLTSKYVIDDHSLAGYVDELLDSLTSGHKFILPDNGELLGRDLTPAMTAGQRLPFPVTVLEMRVRRISGVIPPDKFYSPGEIVVCREGLREDGTSGFNIATLSKVDGLWAPARFTIFAPYAPSDDFHVSMAYKRTPPPDFTVDTCINHYRHALRAVLQLNAALSCTNVTTELIRPNREARAARPESTLFDYHVLMIRPGAERHEGPSLGGSHASPRTHLRRGHIRQHPTAGRIWVNSCVVNPTAIGSVNKDYQLQRGIQ